MKKLLLFLAVVLISTTAFAQSVTLTFIAKDAANQHVQLNRVSITNLTKGWQETIYWPDTTWYRYCRCRDAPWHVSTIVPKQSQPLHRHHRGEPDGGK